MNDTTFQGDGKIAFVPVVVNAKQHPQTNADRIRGMTDEELATNFAGRCCPKKDEFYDCGKLNGKSFSWEDCRKCWLDWLKSPVEVDNG